MDSDGSNLRRLTNHAAKDRSPSWSPDGRQIAFSSNRDGNFDIYVMGEDGSNPTRLTNPNHTNRIWDNEPAWSPDGGRIAFSSNRDGNFDIYVMGEDGSNPTRLTTDILKDRNPAWSPDGGRIAFSSNRNHRNRGENYAISNFDIYVMEVDDAGTLEPEVPIVNREPTFSGDGCRSDGY